MGRIKVTVAEGYIETSVDVAKGPFVRIRNLITFSFHHAPLSERNLGPLFKSLMQLQVFSRIAVLRGQTRECGNGLGGCHLQCRSQGFQ